MNESVRIIEVVLKSSHLSQQFQLSEQFHLFANLSEIKLTGVQIIEVVLYTDCISFKVNLDRFKHL